MEKIEFGGRFSSDGPFKRVTAPQTVTSAAPTMVSDLEVRFSATVMTVRTRPFMSLQ